MPPIDHQAEIRRRTTEGRVLAAVAVAKRLPTFTDLTYNAALQGVRNDELALALDNLVRRGLLAVETFPSQTNPLFDPPVVCYRSVGLLGGASLTSKAGA